MSFVQRELDRISRALHEPHSAERYAQLYAAQQALSWAMEPTGFRSPYDTVMDIEADQEDCLARIRPPVSSDSGVLHELRQSPKQFAG